MNEIVVLAAGGLLAVAGLIVATRARSETASVRTELDRIKLYDPLTGLPNRKQLTGWLTEALTSSRRSVSRVAVLMLELDDFQFFNTTYGHEVGDGLMVAVTRQIQKELGPNDRLVRYGGPSFVIIRDDVADNTAAGRLAAKVLDAVQVAFEIGEDRVRVNAHVGITVTDERAASPEDVLMDATVAAEAAGAKPTSDTDRRVVSFDRSMRSTMSPSTAEHRLREALERGEFWLLYMPVVSLADSKVVGVEALLRWADPDVGLISPGDFLPALETTGLIVPVGNWVLQEACRQAKIWEDRFPAQRGLEVTINLSPRQMTQIDFLDRLDNALSASGASADRLCLEITEGGMVNDVNAAWSMLRQAKNLGIKLALDDFGTGASSLNYVRKFQLDNLKIDRTFVEGLGSNPEDTAIAKHMIAMAHSLGMVAVAEGVENRQQVRDLKLLGCDQAQGYFFSTPQSADAIEALVTRGIDARSADAEAAAGDGAATSEKPGMS